jgi:hypothetical protein
MALGGDEFIVEVGNVSNKGLVARCSFAQCGSSTVTTQEIPDKPPEHEPIGSGSDLQVVIGERRSFRSTRIDDTN